MRRVVTGVALTGLVAGALSMAGGSATAAPTSLTLSGHGFGHGRGMGQYGAYGYALQGWSVGQILAHYYGNTALSPTSAAQAAQPIDVRLDEFDAATTISAQGSGLTASWSGGSTSAAQVTVVRSAGGLTVNGTAVNGDVTLSATGPVAVALGNGSRSYLGSVVVKSAAAQVWNVLPLDDYVAGVVPAESPASWGTNGEASLEAQAVAARSYALARLAQAGGPICDTTACQVYEGDPDVAGDPTNSAYTKYSDQAVTATEGQVLTCTVSTCGAVGSVALAEFSSSTGGYTAGGAFPAVVDDGDGYAGTNNPYHAWHATISADQVQAAFPSIGTLQSVVVTARNGLGDMGGRVEQLQVTGSSGSVSVTGGEFEADFGLYSDWFSVDNSGQPSGGTDGYWILAGDGSVHAFGSAPDYGSVAGAALSAPVIGLAPTGTSPTVASPAGYWEVAADGGVFSYGNARFYGSTGAIKLARPVIGIASTASGHGYWLFAADGGVFTFGDARFYGSTGGIRLVQPIVGMASTADGGGYWLVAADGGIFTYGDARFYGSLGGVHLAQPVVGMVPTADGGGYTLVARDGGVFAFGDARFVGSLPGEGVTDSVSAVAPTADGGGYLVLGRSGRAYPFGDAPYFGDLGTVTGWSGGALDIAGRPGG